MIPETVTERQEASSQQRLVSFRSSELLDALNREWSGRSGVGGISKTKAKGQTS